MRFLGLLLISGVTVATSMAQSGVANAGFESGSPGQTPSGWFVPPAVAASGYVAQISKENPKEGKQCAFVMGGGGSGFGNLMQSIPAGPFRGKRVRFRAAVRYDRGNQRGQAQLWFRVDRANEQMGFFNNMGDRPITTPTWAFYEIIGDVAADAESLNFGLMLVGGGRAWIDAVSIDLGGKEEPVEKPRPLTDQGLVNLVAYTKLLGYVRHFHPSDAVEKADWNRWALAGIPAVEGATGPADLAGRLEKFFLPLAPSVRVYVTGQKPTVVPAAKGNQVVYWTNVGFGGGKTPGLYRATRTFAKSVDRTSTVTADLGGGVSCEVPVTLSALNTNALPRTEEPTVPKTVRATPTGNDRTTRLADVALAWNVYQHFYPYFDVVKVDWEAALRRALSSAATDPDEKAFLHTLRRLVANARDGHGYVGHASDDAYAQPPLVADWVGDKFVVTVSDPSATKIQPGDVIVSIDGKSTEEAWKATESEISGATEGWRRSRGRTALLAGPPGSSVTLGYVHGGGAPLTAVLRRSPGLSLKERRPKPIEELKPGYWYVDLDGERANVEDYRKVLKDLAAAPGVIFDLRGYPNDVAMDVITRLGDKPITSAQWNVPTYPLPDQRDVAFAKSSWNSMPPAVPRFRGKVAFITDGRAISYAESIMGIVENYKLAAIVGEPTAGTNGNINPFDLPGGYTIVFTGMKVLKHDGSTHHGVGILPTIPVHRTVEGIAAGKDELLEKALAYVRG